MHIISERMEESRSLRLQRVDFIKISIGRDTRRDFVAGYDLCQPVPLQVVNQAACGVW